MLSVLFKVLYLLHDLTEYLRTVLRRITVLDQADFDIKLQLVADNLIVEPVSKRRFCINDLLDLFRQGPAFIIDRDAINNLVRAIFEIILITQGHQDRCPSYIYSCLQILSCFSLIRLTKHKPIFCIVNHTTPGTC